MRVVIVLFLLTLGAGCESKPRLAAVRGRVTYKGSPLHLGSIVFTPDALRGNRGTQARADIQPDGTFELRTGDVAGAVPGWHRVTVLAVELVAVTPGDLPTLPRVLLPGRYGDPELSGLTREVLAGRENQCDLDLE